MDNEINYQSNPLHGVSLKAMLMKLVDHYGFDILYAYLYINCFKTNPSIASSVRFLNKTTWARESVENFFLYQYNNLPKASAEQFSLPPRDRVIPEGQVPGSPAELSLEDAERLRAKRAKKADGFRSGPRRGAAPQHERGASKPAQPYQSKPRRESSESPAPAKESAFNPWGKWKE